MVLEGYLRLRLTVIRGMKVLAFPLKSCAKEVRADAAFGCQMMNYAGYFR
ncbi:unnamed protein product [Linum tenue]|uniref:Uncharacterized protein n=1 Tax=Linum tenue TaxID=586396 RepID=A0AAV0S014_9ROSI|nr:unnamed protein product [Linum tenue]